MATFVKHVLLYKSFEIITIVGKSIENDVECCFQNSERTDERWFAEQSNFAECPQRKKVNASSTQGKDLLSKVMRKKHACSKVPEAPSNCFEPPNRKSHFGERPPIKVTLLQRFPEKTNTCSKVNQ